MAPADDTPASHPRPVRPGRPARHAPSADDAARPAESRLGVRLLQSVDILFSRIYHRLEVHNRCPLPRDGPAIIVSNHTSGLDPLLIQSVCPRLVRWMMAGEYYDLKPLNWVFRTIEAIPVARGGRDLAATRAALRVLGRGQVLGVFPEGRIERSRDLLPFQTGVAMMAIHADAPVFPCYLDGTQRGKESMLRAFLEPARATLVFGPSVQFDRSRTDKDSLERATAQIRAAVQRLQDRTLARRPRVPAPLRAD